MLWVQTMSSPACKPKLKRTPYGKYQPACRYCNWESEKVFSSKAEANRWFKRHTYDDPATYSSDLQRAMENLRNAGLIA